MYAIIETGSKQYKVKQGDVIDIEWIKEGPDVLSESGHVSFGRILFLQNGSTPKIGLPYLTGCTVSGELIEETRGPKVLSFKYKQRKNYRRKVGHRQNYLRVKITEIKG